MGLSTKDLPPMTRRYNNMEVSGLVEKVSVFSLEELVEYVSFDCPAFKVASDFFLRGGTELRLYPAESEDRIQFLPSGVKKDFGWALLQLRDGKKLRRPEWIDNKWIILVNDEFKLNTALGFFSISISTADVLADDWEIVG